MQKLTILAVLALAWQAVAIFAGEPVGSSKQVIAPSPAPAPEFFRPNEFDVGVFGTYATGVGSGENAGALQAWGGGAAAGIITGDFMLRLPLDEFWPRLHLAPYIFGGFGGILLGNEGNENTASETFTVTNAAGVSRQVTFKAQEVNSLRYKFGTDRVLGHFGGGLEYRFTPHIGVFSEAGFDVVNGSSNNFVQVNFDEMLFGSRSASNR